MLMWLGGIKLARLSPVCCDTSGHLMVFIGADESGTGTPVFRPPLRGDLKLPVKMTKAYHQLLAQMDSAVISGLD